jgi:Ca2+-binding EF-hand superfamily protein
MISPKDAYRKWNNPRSGYLTFEEFYSMMKELYSQASENLPEYQQLEDIFTFIDIRKDGQIDFQEFTQVFRGCNPPNLLMGTTPAPADQIISKKASDKEENLPIREKSIPLFRHSQ